MGKNATTNHGNQREQPCVWGSSSFLSSLWHLPHPLQKRSPAAGAHGAPKMLVEATHLAAKAVSAAPISPRNARLPPIAQPHLSHLHRLQLLQRLQPLQLHQPLQAIFWPV